MPGISGKRKSNMIENDNSPPKSMKVYDDAFDMIKKCDCHPFLSYHIVTSNSEYYRCEECNINIMKLHLIDDQYYPNGDVLCGMCSKVNGT